MPLSSATPNSPSRSRARNDVPTSARNMSAPAHEVFGKSNENIPPPNVFVAALQAKATPPPTPPRNNNAKSPNVFSPAYSSPNPTKPSAIPATLSAEVRAKPTPPPTPPRPFNALAASSPCAGSPNVFSPPLRANPLGASTPAKASAGTPSASAPFRNITAIATASPGCSSPVPSRRAHALAASSGTPNVFSPAPPPRANNLAVSSPACASPAPLRRANALVVEAPRTPNVSSPAPLRRANALAAPVPSDVSSPLVARRAIHPLAASSSIGPVGISSPSTKLSESRDDHPVNDQIFSLKSSRGVNVVRSPMAKDFLLSQLATKSDSPLTRSRSPPPRTPGCASPACASPMCASPMCGSPVPVRKLSEPLPYDHLQRKELTGSCDAIGMPYNVSHTAHSHPRAARDDAPVVITTGPPIYEKSGYLHKLAGSTFKERWFECKSSVLSYYEKKGGAKPRAEIYLNDCEFRRDTANKRPFTMNLLHTPTKKNYYFAAANAELMGEWLRALQSSGAVDKDLIVMEKEAKEKARKQEEARKAREMKKQEDEYVKAKLKKRSTLKVINKNMSDDAMTSCLCSMAVQEIVEKDQGQEFKINVTFDDQHWTIMRSYDKVVKMYDAVSKLKFVKGMCPPRKCPADMSASEFSQMQISKLQNLLDILARNRPCVFASSGARGRFLRFIAPVGWDDHKPDQFVMPFQFDF